MCFQRCLKQTKHEKSFKGPVVALLPPFSRPRISALPAPPTFIFTIHVFSVCPSHVCLRLYAANHFLSRRRVLSPLFPHLGQPPLHLQTHTHTQKHTLHPSLRIFRNLDHRLTAVYHVLELLFTVTETMAAGAADYGVARSRCKKCLFGGRAANFSANRISTGGRRGGGLMPGIWLPKANLGSVLSVPVVT